MKKLLVFAFLAVFVSGCSGIPKMNHSTTFYIQRHETDGPYGYDSDGWVAGVSHTFSFGRPAVPAVPEMNNLYFRNNVNISQNQNQSQTQTQSQSQTQEGGDHGHGHGNGHGHGHGHGKGQGKGHGKGHGHDDDDD